MKQVLKALLFLSVLLSFHSSAEARFHHGGVWAGPGLYGSNWRRGYWFHGAYGGRDGWWWVIGPTWYYYTSPVYPYPPAGAQAVYIVQVPNALPPPASPPPESKAGGTPVPTATAPESATAEINGKKAAAFTYYCEKTKGYYPAITVCAEGWVATPVKGPN